MSTGTPTAPITSNAPATTSPADSNSLVDYLTGKGMDASPAGRATLYEQQGLGSASDYTRAYNATVAGTGNNASLNENLLAKLNGGPAPAIQTSTASRLSTAKNTGNLATAVNSQVPPAPVVPTVSPSVTNPSGSPAAATSASGGSAAPVTSPATPATTNPSIPSAVDASDPILSGLASLQQSSDATTARLIASTMAAYQNNVNTVNSQYDSYKRGLQSLGIEHNAAQATPDLLSSQIQGAANDQMQKINSLQATETKTIMDAQAAQQKGDFQTLQDEMTRLNDIQTAKQTAIKDMYDTMVSQNTISKDNATAVYEEMQNVPADQQEQFLQTVAQQLQVPLTDLVSNVAIAGQTASKDKLTQESEEDTIALDNLKLANGGTLPGASGSGKVAFTSADNGYLANAGMSPSDITKTEAYINQYGVQAAFNSGALSQPQKDAITKILTPATSTTDALNTLIASGGSINLGGK